MEDHIIIGVDLHGEWVENPTRYTWRSKGRETVPIKISENVTYDELVDISVSRFELDCDKNDLSISYMLGFIEKQKGAPSRIRNDLDLRFFLDDQSRPILSISVVEKIIEITNSVVNDEEHPVTMDIPINEEASLHPISTQGSRYTDDDGTDFYKGKIFKDKQELTKLLKLASVKKDQRFKSVKSSKDYRNIHSCGAQHLTSHHPHASADVIAEYIQPNYLNGKGPSTKDIKNIVQTDLGCKISYWKCWKSSEIAKAMIRGTPEHGYAVLDGYRHMLMTINEGSKTSLKLDDKGRFKYFFASYGAWIRGFVHMRKVLAVDGTFLRGRYDGVLLFAVAQDTENHVFPVAFCVVDKECDAAYDVVIMLQYKRKRTGTSSSNPNAKENAGSLTAARKRGTTTLQSINGQPSGEEKSDQSSDDQSSEMEKNSKNNSDLSEKKIETHWLKMASKKSVFNSYPWGRVSFDLTINYLLKELDSTKSQYNLHGCPWAFAAWAFEAIPALQ
ncbi:hypothetical protein KY290_009162 [Solanum tuberosum]|uniref:MULE transposase domain-containing protein n=1 Tax=Solanum tuberosum TaxID=4113 RepID=A0ABQ7WBX2_SOLTU|nr:hypothetical protein KY290_009162 [Solanum tuberosum]